MPESRATIPVHQTLLSACREMRIPVIYTKFVAGPDPILLWEWSPVHAPPVCSCWKGVKRLIRRRGRGARLLGHHRRAHPEPGEPIVEKFGYGAFHDTELDDLLKEREVESVLVTGTVTQICVEETARESSNAAIERPSSPMPSPHTCPTCTPRY